MPRSCDLQKKRSFGYKLNGRFSAMGSTVNTGSSQSNAFNEDGTFGLKATAEVSSGEETGKLTDYINGRYSISGNTLILQFNYSQTTRPMIYITSIGGKKHLIINKGSYPQE